MIDPDAISDALDTAVDPTKRRCELLPANAVTLPLPAQAFPADGVPVIRGDVVCFEARMIEAFMLSARVVGVDGEHFCVLIRDFFDANGSPLYVHVHRDCVAGIVEEH